MKTSEFSLVIRWPERTDGWVNTDPLPPTDLLRIVTVELWLNRSGFAMKKLDTLMGNRGELEQAVNLARLTVQEMQRYLPPRPEPLSELLSHGSETPDVRVLWMHAVKVVSESGR